MRSRARVFVGWVVAACLAQASAATAVTIGFVPSSSTVQVGDLFGIDVVVSDLPSTDVVSAYDLDIAFDESLLAFSSLTFGTGLGLPPFGFATPLPGGILQASQVSLLFDSELLALQGGSLTLFTIEFEALASGTSFLSFLRGTDDIKGIESDVPFIPSILDVAALPGQVEVVESAAEPATGGLLALAFLAIIGRCRRRS